MTLTCQVAAWLAQEESARKGNTSVASRTVSSLTMERGGIRERSRQSEGKTKRCRTKLPRDINSVFLINFGKIVARALQVCPQPPRLDATKTHEHAAAKNSYQAALSLANRLKGSQPDTAMQ